MYKLLSCPDCGSQNVTAHDNCASCECLDCEWSGKRMNLKEVGK